MGCAKAVVIQMRLSLPGDEIQMLGALVALGDPFPPLDALIEPAGNGNPRVHAKPATEARVGIGQARRHAEGRTAYGASGEHHAHAVNLDFASDPAELVGNLRDHTARSATVVDDAGHSHVGIHARTVIDRLGNQDLRRVLLRVVGTADLAKPGALTANSIVRQRPALPAQSEHAALQDLVVRVSPIARDLGHRKITFDALERGPKLRFRKTAHPEVSRPVLEDLGRQALAQVDVVHRRAPDAATADDANREVRGHPRTRILVQLREHLILALGHVLGPELRTFLERDHLRPALGKLARGHAAAGSGSDDDHVRRQAHAARQPSTRMNHRDHRMTGPVYPMAAQLSSRRYRAIIEIPLSAWNPARSAPTELCSRDRSTCSCALGPSELKRRA